MRSPSQVLFDRAITMVFPDSKSRTLLEVSRSSLGSNSITSNYVEVCFGVFKSSEHAQSRQASGFFHLKIFQMIVVA